MANDFIPPGDADFEVWVGKFLSGVKTNLVALGVAQPAATALETAVTNWKADRLTAEQAKAAARAAVEQQNKARDAAEASVRSVTHTINGNPTVDNAMRALVALPPHDEGRSPIGAPTTKPIGRLEPKGHYTLVLHFVDETTPHRTAKPHGIHGCRIFSHVGDPAPADPSGYTFLALDTKTPYVDEHPAADAGKTVYYLLQWENAKGQNGPWSDVISAKIPT